MSKQMRELQARKSTLVKEARALTDRAAADNRDMSDEEVSAFDALKVRIESASSAIDREASLIAEEAQMAIGAMNHPRSAHIGVLVDHPQQVQALANAAEAHAVRLDVYVEVNVGANRCGVEPGDAAVQLARQIVASPSLRFAGLQCYQGPAQHLRAPQDRAAAIGSAVAAARATRQAIERCGIAVERVTGAGTGSFVHERDSGVFNEIQAGSYIFMDRDYGDNQRGEGDIAFEHALFVRTTVMSRTNAEWAVVDAGLKASSVDSGMPVVWQRSDLRYLKAADEHGVLATADAAALSLGDPLMLVPGHCDPTVNLYDELVCVRGERVAALWPIAARGALL